MFQRREKRPEMSQLESSKEDQEKSGTKKKERPIQGPLRHCLISCVDVFENAFIQTTQSLRSLKLVSRNFL